MVLETPPQQWEKYAAGALEQLGFKKGLANAVCFFHPERDMLALIHGDDFLVCGSDENLEWLAEHLSKTVWVKVVGKLGGQPEKGDVRELKCLNRIITWEEQGISLEADPRHAEILTAMLGPEARPLTTPGVKRRGRTQGRIHDPEEQEENMDKEMNHVKQHKEANEEENLKQNTDRENSEKNQVYVTSWGGTRSDEPVTTEVVGVSVPRGNGHQTPVAPQLAGAARTTVAPPPAELTAVTNAQRPECTPSDSAITTAPLCYCGI